MNVAKFVDGYCCNGIKLAIYSMKWLEDELISIYEGSREDLISDPIHNLDVLVSEVKSIDIGHTRTLLIVVDRYMEEMIGDTAVKNVEPEAPSVGNLVSRIDTEITKSLVEEVDIARKKGKGFNEF